MRSASLVLTLAALAPACSQIDDVQIAHHRSACEGIVPYAGVVDSTVDKCYGLRSIDGFTHVWGHDYELRVEVEEIEDADDDAPTERYRLVELVDDRVADPASTFDYAMRRYPQLIGDNGERYDGTITLAGSAGELFDGTPFICETAAVCSELATAIADDNRYFRVTFGYSPETSLPLIARGLVEN